MPNIREFAKFIHVKNARDMTFYIVFFLKNKLVWGGLQTPTSAVCISVVLVGSVTAITPSVALHMHRVVPDSSEHGPAL